jgi:hypothetical protein
MKRLFESVSDNCFREGQQHMRNLVRLSGSAGARALGVLAAGVVTLGALLPLSTAQAADMGTPEYQPPPQAQYAPPPAYYGLPPAEAAYGYPPPAYYPPPPVDYYSYYGMPYYYGGYGGGYWRGYGPRFAYGYGRGGYGRGYGGHWHR